MQIQYEKCTRRNCPKFTHCPAVNDQCDCVLNDLEELGDKEFLVMADQYNLEIFFCCLRLLPFYSSTFHQTNVENSQIRTEDNLLISRIQSLRLLHEVILRAEEGCSVFLPLCTPDWIEFVVQYQSKISSQISTVLVDEQPEVRLRGFALAFDRLAKTSTFVFNANSSNSIPARCRRPLCCSRP